MLRKLSLLAATASCFAPRHASPKTALRATADAIPASEWDKWSCSGDACGVDSFDEADDGIEVCGVESRERISEDAAPRRPSETADAAAPAGLGRVAQL